MKQRIVGMHGHRRARQWLCGGAVSVHDRGIYQRKFMGHPSIRGQLGTKAQSREHLVTVVVLDDLAHSFEGHGIGIHLIGVHIVQ